MTAQPLSLPQANLKMALWAENAAKGSIAHQRPSLFQSTEKFKMFDRIYPPKHNFRIELLSSVAFRLNLPRLHHGIETP